MSHVAGTTDSRPSSPTTAENAADLPLTVIEPQSGWQPIPWRELWRHRELLYFLAWRDVKVRYKQTLLGALWAILQPTLMMVVFTLVFGRGAQTSSSGVAYPLFVYAGLVGWTLFATAVANAAQSVVSAERLVTKVYFPRLSMPLAAIGASLVDFVLASAVLFALMIFYGQPLSAAVFLMPLAALLLIVAAVGFGSALAALNVAYRDVRYALPFLMQLWLLATPSVYLESRDGREPSGVRRQASGEMARPAMEEPRRAGKNWLALNPIDGLVAFFRSAVLGSEFEGRRLIYPAAAACGALVAGCYYFRRVEDSFADII
ncbi:MAG: ABC transporter permease [Pirellulales bacterium]